MPPIEPTEMERLREIFVEKEDCNKHKNDVEKRLAQGSTDFALIGKELTWLKWLMFASIGERLLSFISGKIIPYFMG